MENTIVLGIQIVPKSKTLDSYALVDQAIAVIQKAGVPYEVTAFETVMEGPQEQLMHIAQEAQQAVLDAGADEVLVYYRIHAKNGKNASITEKTGKFKGK